MTITEFLLARIAEDEATARATLFEQTWTAHPDETGQPIRAGRARIATCAQSVMGHIARHDPARVLAECEAKRRIVKEVETTRRGQFAAPGTGTLALNYGLDSVLRALALPYADHPDYREEWRA